MIYRGVDEYNSKEWGGWQARAGHAAVPAICSDDKRPFLAAASCHAGSEGCDVKREKPPSSDESNYKKTLSVLERPARQLTTPASPLPRAERAGADRAKRDVSTHKSLRTHLRCRQSPGILWEAHIRAGHVHGLRSRWAEGRGLNAQLAFKGRHGLYV